MTLQRLEVTPFPEVIGDVVTSGRTGTLLVIHGAQRTSLDWVNGELVLVRPSDPGRSFGAWLFHKKLVDEATGRSIAAYPAPEIVRRFHETASFDSARRNSYLRDWTRAVFQPLFSLTEGTAAFEEAEAIDPDDRIFFQSTAPLIIEGVRSISNGLVIRASLGDIGRRIEIESDPAYPIEDLPLVEKERAIARSLENGSTLDAFLRQWPNESLNAARVAIMLLMLGVWIDAREGDAQGQEHDLSSDDSERDLMLLAQLGPSDTKSLNAMKLAKRIPSLDLYEILEMTRGAQGSAIIERAERLKREYDPASFPPVMSDIVQTIRTAIERAKTILSNPGKRKEYDQLLARGAGDKAQLDQYVARRAIAIGNLQLARELHIKNDFYGAILLLRQAVRFDPGNPEAWHLLGDCEARNPKWRRDAAVSFQKALAADPKYVDALLSLGDLYRQEGLPARAKAFYDDVLAIDPENSTAKSRLAKL